MIIEQCMYRCYAYTQGDVNYKTKAHCYKCSENFVQIPKEYKSISAPLPSHMFYVTEYRPLLTLPLSCHYSQNLSKVAEMLVPFNP